MVTTDYLAVIFTRPSGISGWRLCTRKPLKRSTGKCSREAYSGFHTDALVSAGSAATPARHERKARRIRSADTQALSIGGSVLSVLWHALAGRDARAPSE